jgi:hypothetical protein
LPPSNAEQSALAQSISDRTAEKLDARKVDAKSEANPEFSALTEGRIVKYMTPNSWRANSRNQPRAALVVFCYRDALGEPTGTVNLCVFLNGPADTGDMIGPKTRCTEFISGVKFGEGLGNWNWNGKDSK